MLQQRSFRAAAKCASRRRHARRCPVLAHLSRTIATRMGVRGVMPAECARDLAVPTMARRSRRWQAEQRRADRFRQADYDAECVGKKWSQRPRVENLL